MMLSIVIVNYRGWKRLRPCLESLRALKGEEAGITCEVVVVDNQSNDSKLGDFIAEFPEFNFIENFGNFGFANGCNFGAKRSTGEYLLFLNPDTIVSLDAIQKLLAKKQDRPELTVLSCRQTTDKGKDDKPFGLFLTPKTITSLMRSVYKLTHKKLFDVTINSGAEVIFPDWISGSVVMISRHDFERFNGWSEDFWMYFEDMDFCRRIWNEGGRVALLNTAEIIHNHGGASRVNPTVKALTKSEVIISRHIYVHKHFKGARRFFMQAYLVLNNVILEQLLFALLGLLLWFRPKLRAYLNQYFNVLGYYFGAMKKGTWISPRSPNYDKERADPSETQAEAA